MPGHSNNLSHDLNTELKVRYSSHDLNSKLKVHHSSHQSSNLWTTYDLNSKLSVHFSNYGLNNEPFKEKTILNHSNTELVCYSDPHCTFINWAFKNITNSTAPSVETHHRSVGPDAGRNSGGKRIIKNITNSNELEIWCCWKRSWIPWVATLPLSWG